MDKPLKWLTKEPRPLARAKLVGSLVKNGLTFEFVWEENKYHYRVQRPNKAIFQHYIARPGTR